MRTNHGMIPASHKRSFSTFMQPDRCWPTSDLLLLDYHDTEWGTPLHDDKRLFEFFILGNLEGERSWLDILRKRGSFRRALDDFDYEKIALYGSRKVDALLQDTDIFLHKLSIETMIRNADAFIKVRADFGSFDCYIWGFTNGKQVENDYRTISEIPLRAVLSDLICADLRNRGFVRIGSSIMYSFMQAVGIVNDHIKGCFRYENLRQGLDNKRIPIGRSVYCFGH